MTVGGRRLRLPPLRRMRSWQQWTVRSRIVLSVVALATVAVVTTDVAATVLLRRYLIDRVDQQLAAQSTGFRHNPRPFDPSSDRQRPQPFSPDFRMYLYSGTGQLVEPPLARAEAGPDLGSLGDVREHADDAAPTTVDGDNGVSWRVRVTRLDDDAGYTVTAVSLQDIESTQDGFLLIETAISGLMLLLIGAAAAGVVRMGLLPLTRMQETAETIAAGDLSPRIADADPHTEAGRLGAALNTMLGQIESAVAEQAASERRLRRLLADAAHELRTPLTSIQGFAELYRRGGAPPGPPLDEAMGRIESEVGRMRLLVNDMLLLARLDEERPLHCKPVDLLGVVADSIRDAHVRVPTRFVELAALDERCETFEPVTALADEQRIRQVVTNLVANALQHTPDDARVVVKVGRPTGAEPVPPTVAIGAEPAPDRPLAVVEVVDTGPGMTAAVAARIFERLYRADPSRSRSHGGAGLGLAIVSSIVKAHDGRVELWTAPGAGARFRVLLPARPPVPDDEDELDGLNEPGHGSPHSVFDEITSELPGLRGGSEEA